MSVILVALSFCISTGQGLPNSTELLPTLPDDIRTELWKETQQYTIAGRSDHPSLEGATLDIMSSNLEDGEDLEEDGSTKVPVESDTARMLRGSFNSDSVAAPRQLSKHRRRRHPSGGFEDPCTGISVAACDTVADVCIAGCLDISSCKKKCEKKLEYPCWDKIRQPCEDAALDLCEEAIKKAGEKSCAEICTEAAATADAAGGGPEDPAADVVAADIEASCEMSCAAAVDTSGLTPGTDEFASVVCKGMGF